MNETSMLLNLADDSQRAADLLCDAICNGCQSCISEISDINRHAIFELSEGERRAMKEKTGTYFLRAAHALSRCVAHAFSAAVLLPPSIPSLQPLCEIASASSQLASYPRRFLSVSKEAPPLQTYSLHLAANKGRGAHALLLTNVCSTETGRYLLPLALALETHRNSLESACNLFAQLTCEASFEAI